MKCILLLTVCGLLIIGIAGCKLLAAATRVATTAGVATGVMSASQAQSINKVSDATGKAFEKFTPEHEYYIGRALGAQITTRYGVYDNPQVNQYLNTMGQALAELSDNPDTFRGYRFLALDSDEVNAFATPGGFVFVTRGLLRCCKNEDSIAAVLAHEIGHIQLEHGMNAIKGTRVTSLVKTALLEAGKQLGPAELNQATEIFGDTLGDISSKLIDKGYQRGQEFDADKTAITIMNRAGYNPNALRHMLAEMQKGWQAGGSGFMKTHPSPKDRNKEVLLLVKDYGPVKSPAARQARFAKALKGI